MPTLPQRLPNQRQHAGIEVKNGLFQVSHAPVQQFRGARGSPGSEIVPLHQRNLNAARRAIQSDGRSGGAATNNEHVILMFLHFRDILFAVEGGRGWSGTRNAWFAWAPSSTYNHTRRQKRRRPRGCHIWRCSRLPALRNLKTTKFVINCFFFVTKFVILVKFNLIWNSNSEITSTRRSNVTFLRRIDVIFEFEKFLLNILFKIGSNRQHFEEIVFNPSLCFFFFLFLREFLAWSILFWWFLFLRELVIELIIFKMFQNWFDFVVISIN